MRMPLNRERSLQTMRRNHRLRCGFAILGSAAVLTLLACSLAAQTAAKPDAAASRTAFLQFYRVLTSPRCQNCHPAGDAPLQGDDSHVHLQNVKRGVDGQGMTAMRCDTCHQAANLPGAHLPPGSPRWSLPSLEVKMVFGGRSLGNLLDHVGNDDLVGWGWNPGDGRTLPPLSRADTVEQMRIWIAGGAACPE